MSAVVPAGQLRALYLRIPLAARVAIVFGALLALHAGYAFIAQVNSDEPQHLHVVWGWTQGLLQYRDVFDNHTPLFHILCAPLLDLFGERADILILMRLALLPLYALGLWSVYRIGRALYSPPTGQWAALATGLQPVFFFLTVQFRTDALWAPLWLLVIVVAIEGRFGGWRAFSTGVLLGATAAVSMKTSLLLGALLLAALTLLALLRFERTPVDWARAARLLLVALLGTLLIPALLIAWYATQGALAELYYGVIAHNIVPQLGRWQHWPWRPFVLPLVTPVLYLAARALLRRCADRDRGVRRALVFLVMGYYIAALYSYWPLFSRQDLLPALPLLAIFAVAGLRGEGRARPDSGYPRLLLALLLLEFAVLLSGSPPWRNSMQATTQTQADILRLTDPGDYVMDAKGAAVYRRRPFFYALEGITQQRMEQGSIADTITADLIATRTAAGIFERLPERDQRFVDANYVAVTDRIMVAGQWLRSTTDAAAVGFDIVLPLRYAVVGAHGAAVGTLDGQPYSVPVTLAPGHHEFQPTHADGPFALVWAQALERGFSPLAEGGVEKK